MLGIVTENSNNAHWKELHQTGVTQIDLGHKIRERQEAEQANQQ